MLKKKRNYKEHRDIEAFFEWFRYQYPRVIAYKNQNEGKRDPRFVKSGGILSGVPDIFIAKPVCSKHGLYIEMKPSDGSGRLRQSQKEIIEALLTENYVAEISVGWEQAKNIAMDYLNGHYH
jgi:hypothetical protein